MDALYVGIDISKGSSSAHGLDEKGSKSFTLTFQMDSDGFAELLKAIKEKAKDLSSVMVAMESTACYHINLFSYLTAKGMDVFIINPLLISNFVKLSLRKTKTDKKDALVIAQFLLMNRETIRQSTVSSEIEDLRDLSRQRESLVDQMTAVKNDMGRMLNITFPELEGICGLFTKSMLRLLSRYPSAQAIRKASSLKISKLLIPGSMGKNMPETVKRIRDAAKISVGTTSTTKEMLRQNDNVLKYQNRNVLLDGCNLSLKTEGYGREGHYQDELEGVEEAEGGTGGHGQAHYAEGGGFDDRAF